MKQRPSIIYVVYTLGRGKDFFPCDDRVIIRCAYTDGLKAQQAVKDWVNDCQKWCAAYSTTEQTENRIILQGKNGSTFEVGVNYCRVDD